jgi:hypothetical protein
MKLTTRVYRAEFHFLQTQNSSCADREQNGLEGVADEENVGRSNASVVNDRDAFHGFSADGRIFLLSAWSTTVEIDLSQRQSDEKPDRSVAGSKFRQEWHAAGLTAVRSWQG